MCWNSFGSNDINGVLKIKWLGKVMLLELYHSAKSGPTENKHSCACMKERGKNKAILFVHCTQKIEWIHLFCGFPNSAWSLSSIVRSKFSFRDHVDRYLNIYSLVKYMQQTSRLTSVKTRLYHLFVPMWAHSIFDSLWTISVRKFFYQCPRVCNLV